MLLNLILVCEHNEHFRFLMFLMLVDRELTTTWKEGNNNGTSEDLKNISSRKYLKCKCQLAQVCGGCVTVCWDGVIMESSRHHFTYSRLLVLLLRGEILQCFSWCLVECNTRIHDMVSTTASNNNRL